MVPPKLIEMTRFASSSSHSPSCVLASVLVEEDSDLGKSTEATNPAVASSNNLDPGDPSSPSLVETRRLEPIAPTSKLKVLFPLKALCSAWLRRLVHDF